MVYLFSSSAVLNLNHKEPCQFLCLLCGPTCVSYPVNSSHFQQLSLNSAIKNTSLKLKHIWSMTCLCVLCNVLENNHVCVMAWRQDQTFQKIFLLLITHSHQTILGLITRSALSKVLHFTPPEITTRPIVAGLLMAWRKHLTNKNAFERCTTRTTHRTQKHF